MVDEVESDSVDDSDSVLDDSLDEENIEKLEAESEMSVTVSELGEEYSPLL